MAIVINSQIVFGIKLHRENTKIFLEWQKNNNLTNDMIIMMLLEEMIIYCYKNSQYFSYMLNDYLQINKKTKRIVVPNKPFWSNFKKTIIKEMQNGNFDKYFKQHCSKENINNELHEKIIFPNFDDSPINFLGIKYGGKRT